MEGEVPKYKREVIKPEVGRYKVYDTRWDDVTESRDLAGRNFDYLRGFLKVEGLDIKKLKFLELGSGNAIFLDYAKKQGLDIVGVDVEPRGETKDSQVIARIEQLPFADQSFDVLFSSFIFDNRYYNNDAQTMTREIFRVLRPGGFYISREPHMEILSFTKFNMRRYREGSDRSYIILQKPYE